MAHAHILSLCSLLFLLLSACAGPSWNNPYPPEPPGKKIFYGSFSERPKHLDPVRSYSSNEYAFIAQIYEPPLQYHYLRRPFTLVPLTARSLPKVRYLDAAGVELPQDTPTERIATSEYEIQIRPGIRFQPHPAFARRPDGGYRYLNLQPRDLADIHILADFPATGTREVTADDYIYQIKRLAVPSLHSPIAGLLGESILGFKDFGTRIDQAQAKARKQQGREEVFVDLRDFPLEGVRKLDDYRYLIRLQGTYPQFVFWLAMPFFAPVPWEADAFYSQAGMRERNISFDWYPVGSGPFMLTENNPNLRMVLQRNPEFHGEAYPEDGRPEDEEAGRLRAAGQPLPFLDAAVYSLEKEDIPYWNKFLQGYYDSSGVSSDNFDQAVRFSAQGNAELTETLAERGIRLSTATSPTVYYLGFNMLDPVVGGLSERARWLRQALSIAIDYEEFIAIFANGRGLAAQGPLPPGIFGHREGAEGINPYVYHVHQGQPKRRPLEEAKALLAKAGYPEGVERATGQPLVLYFDTTATGPDDKARLSWMRKQLQKLGIQLVIRATDYNRFQEKMRTAGAQIFMWGWNADYPDPENFFFLLYGPNAKVGHDGENAANYQNPEFDALFERMKNLSNGPQRLAVIDRMLEILRRDAPWVWGYHPTAFSLHHAWVSNSQPNEMANNSLKYRDIDPEQRARRRALWNPPILWPLGLAVGVLGLGAVPALIAYRRRERGRGR